MTINHSRGSYAIVDSNCQSLFEGLPLASWIITDENVLGAVTGTLPSFPILALSPGEGSKSIETYKFCLEWLAKSGASRKACLVALGGGVIGDLVGFLAATYMRGVEFIQIPTTLLAQVDSSVGGKVGLDLDSGKNLVGSFHPPMEVRLCVELLASLPERQFKSGLAEVIKYGAIMDARLFEELASNPLRPNDERLHAIVLRCIALKAQVVEADEFELTGKRAILNFGHTVAHAIEYLTGYGPVLHGEAVAIGMVVEARLGEKLGVTSPGTTEILSEVLASQNLLTHHSVLSDGEAMLGAMRRDKKAVDGRLAFSLLTHIGGCKLVSAVNEGDVLAVLHGE